MAALGVVRNVSPSITVNKWMAAVGDVSEQNFYDATKTGRKFSSIVHFFSLLI